MLTLTKKHMFCELFKKAMKNNSLGFIEGVHQW